MAPFNASSLLQQPSLFETRGLIAGEWKFASQDKTFPVINPATGETLSDCSNFGQSDFVAAIDSANVGFKQYSRSTTAGQRSILLKKWNELVLQNAEDLAKILSLENGKALYEAKGEIKYAASFISWFAEEATRSYGDTIPSSYDNAVVMTYKEPVGVCSIITPWNFPAAMITRKVAPAFAAGCAVVIKPPSETPFTALALAQLALKAGFPANIMHVVPTKDREASLDLATSPKVNKLSFTGSTEVGKLLAKHAMGTMKRVSMELGGNAPFIVFDDADLDLAVQGALVCKFRSSGQTCVCANRLLVHESVAEEFADKLVKEVEKMRLGSGLDPDVTHGPLINASAVKKVSRHVEDALSKGGVLKAGGKPPSHLGKGFFYSPTVILNATSEMEVARDETFGPLAPIFKFKTEEEALELANDTEFGLAGYFFSKNVARVLRVSQQLQCGMVGVNTGLISAAETPFGGIRESGCGREGSKYGLAEYQNIKAVTIGNNHK